VRQFQRGATSSTSWALSQGLVKKLAAPALTPRTASEIEPQAVISSTGRAGLRFLDAGQQVQAFLAAGLQREVHVLQDQVDRLARQQRQRLLRPVGAARRSRIA
jgi:hypothetical protein